MLLVRTRGCRNLQIPAANRFDPTSWKESRGNYRCNIQWAIIHATKLRGWRLFPIRIGTPRGCVSYYSLVAEIGPSGSLLKIIIKDATLELSLFGPNALHQLLQRSSLLCHM